MNLVGNTLMRVVAELFIGCGLVGYILRDAWRELSWR
jgi:hypothetical protein